MFKPYIIKLSGKWVILNGKLCNGTMAYLDARKYIDKMNKPKETIDESGDFVIRINGGSKGSESMKVFKEGIEVFHKPSGTSAFCNTYRNQFRNKAEALRLLNERRSGSGVVK